MKYINHKVSPMSFYCPFSILSSYKKILAGLKSEMPGQNVTLVINQKIMRGQDTLV